MLSRTASDLYWLSRYFERAENTARMLDVVWNLSLIRYAVDTQKEIAAPLAITGIARCDLISAIVSYSASPV